MTVATGRGTLCSATVSSACRPEIKKGKRAPRAAVYESRSDTHERGDIFVSTLNDSYGTSLQHIYTTHTHTQRAEEGRSASDQYYR